MTPGISASETTMPPQRAASASVADYLAVQLLAHDRSVEAIAAVRHPDAGYPLAVTRLSILEQDERAGLQLTGVSLVALVVPNGSLPRAYVLARRA